MTVRSAIHRYLDPGETLAEVLFGLIMVLGITLTAGLSAGAGPDGVRQLLQAAVGCNIAWGIIDGIMFVMSGMTERAEKVNIIHAVQRAPNAEVALGIVRSELEKHLDAITDSGQREALSRSVVEYIAGSKAPKIDATRDDFYGAIACFWLVFLSCLPAALPFLFFSDPRFALRVSNVLLIAMLFFVGFAWAHYAHRNRLVVGLVMVAIGLTLVGIAALLGG